MDEKDRYLRGNFNTINTSNIRVRLNKCHDKDYCKSDEEIMAFIKNKYMIFYVNEVRFDASKYGEESIIPESRLDWIRVSTTFKV